MLYVFFLTLVFLATVLGLASILTFIRSSDRNTSEPKVESIRHKQLTRSFSSRIFAPVAHCVGRQSLKIVPANIVGRIQHRLILAGSPRNMQADGFLALKVLSVLAVLALVVPIAAISELSAAKLFQTSAILVISAFFLPNIWLSRNIRARQKSIRLSLPDVLDLLTISVEAGVGFDSALTKVVKNHRGPLAQEFFRMLQEMRLGITRRDALKNLNDRTEVPELSSFILSMLQADIFGISVGKVLRIQAKEMRVKRRQDAEEIAMKAPVKMVFPLVLCVFPALLVVILGPAAISIYETLGRGL